MRSNAIILSKITFIVRYKNRFGLLSSLEFPPDLEVNTYVKTLHQSRSLAYLLLSL